MELAKQYGIKSEKDFPAIRVIKSEGKPIKYEGKSMLYSNVFEFINVYSQIFVDPTDKENQASVKQSSASKPWLVVNVPQLTKDSANDVCLQKDGILCVILVSKDKEMRTQNDKMVDEINKVGQSFASKIRRGIGFNMMWLDAQTESDFASTFSLESYPAVVILNPGKRKRFLQHAGEINDTNIEKTLDKILSGDAKFKTIKGNKLPELVSEYPTE